MQRIAIILACLCISTISIAQQYPFIHYTPKDGLVNSRVTKAYQDSKGRMYFLTFGGLSVFDGARFKNYTTDQGLASNLVNDILEAGNDSLLIATNTGIINTLVKGRISKLKTEKDFCPVINHFYRHTNNAIYVSSDEGLFQLENNRVRRLNISSLTNNPTQPPMLGNITGSGNYLVFSSEYFIGHEGIYLYDIKNDRICDSTLGRFFGAVGMDKNNQVWISSPGKFFSLDTTALRNGRLSLIPPESVSLRQIFADNRSLNNNRDSRRAENNPYQVIFINHAGNKGFVSRIPVPDEAVARQIMYVNLDRENNLWLCSKDAGVFKLLSSSFRVFENPVGKAFQGSIYTVYHSIHGTWYSTNTSKLFRQVGTRLIGYDCNLKPSPLVFFDDGIKLLAHDERNIYETRIDRSGPVLVFHKIISLTDSSFFGYRFLVDHHGYVIASVKGGLKVWKNNLPVFNLIIHPFDFVEGLALDKNNFLWVFNRFNNPKLFRLHPEDPANYLEQVHEFNKSQLTGSPRCMVIDKNGAIWVGTRDDGLLMYRQEGNRLKELKHFTTGNGLTDNFVISLACDSLNNIIAGTQTGLDRLVNEGNGIYRVENITKSSNYFAYICDIWVEPGNQVFARTYLGSIIEITESYPERPGPRPQLLLEEIRINAKSTDAKKWLSYKQNNLSFLIAAPSFIDEKQVSYSYLLEGSGNDQWSDTTASNAIINLINLSPGKYKLSVKAFFPSTAYAPADLSYSFIIRPPWWKSWWFRLAAGLISIAILILVIRFYYNRRLEKKMAALEKQQAIEKERTRIATDMHDDLGAGLSRIKFLSETIGIKKQKSQPIEEDISKIREYSHEMIDKMGEIVWALNEKNDSLSDLLSYSRSYAVEYLSQSGIECEVKMPDNFPVLFVSGEFRRNIYLVLKEALHNIVKHSQAGHVKIVVEIDRSLMMLIKDDGMGFNKMKIRPFSNGLENMEKRMKDIGGTVQIKNENGTAVVLIIPLHS